MAALEPDAVLGGAEALERESRLRCRYYEQEYPDAEQLVVVNVKNIAEMGAYVTLLEYDNIEGMILLSELSRRRIRSIPKLIRVGRNEVVMVLRVDKEKGYIDLSKRRVSPEDIVHAEERYNKAKQVHSILRYVASTQNVALKDLYERVGWPMYRKFGHAYEAFKLAVTEPDRVLEGIELEDSLREALLDMIRKRLTPQAVKIRADIEVTCFQYEGIDAIKEALMAGKALSTEEVPLQIQLIAPPLYVMLTSTMNKEAGVELMNQSIEAVRASIERAGGTLNVKVAPRATSQRDDTELSLLLEKSELENREVDGDEAVDE